MHGVFCTLSCLSKIISCSILQFFLYLHFCYHEKLYNLYEFYMYVFCSIFLITQQSLLNSVLEHQSFNTECSLFLAFFLFRCYLIFSPFTKNYSNIKMPLKTIKQENQWHLKNYQHLQDTHQSRALLLLMIHLRTPLLLLRQDIMPILLSLLPCVLQRTLSRILL